MHSNRQASARVSRPFAIVTAILVAACTTLPLAATSDVLDPELFPLPEPLAPNVSFWTTVYTGYPSDRALFHDERYLDVVYTVLDFSDLTDLPDATKRLKRRQRIRDTEARYTAILRDLAAGKEGPEALANEYAKVRALFRDVPGGAGKYTAAIHRFRTQTTLQDRFADGVRRSGAYLPEIERVFAAHGLPKALTRLPFVESLFHVGAHSKVAAAGIWQFMPSTARRYLRMEVEFDERFDPLLATEAAAQHLAGNYRALGTWPLALTAYNHGRAGMARAVRTVGTRDLGRIAETYRSRTFGFASRNFYAEFLAATNAYEQRQRYFPGAEPMPPLSFDQLITADYVSMPALAAATDTEIDELRTLNPGISRSVWRDDLMLPKDYTLRIPKGAGDRYAAAYASLGDEHRADRQRGFHYRVRQGDTLGKIAAKYGTSAGAIQRANKLRSANLIRVGQQLYIPPSRSSASRVRRSASSSTTTSSAPTGTPTTTTTTEDVRYTVRAGDSLSKIAERHGVSIDAVRGANNLRDADQIVAGRTLTIPDATRRTHRVRRGETLASIARRYGTTVNALRSTNRIRSHIIHPAQVLVIP